jgi:hypothetical protein
MFYGPLTIYNLVLPSYFTIQYERMKFLTFSHTYK